MHAIFDVIVVGAGPAGLMAAKICAENGLAVALLERKNDITTVQRSCATMFAIEDDYYFSERMYFNEQARRMVFPVTGFSVPYDGPFKNFFAWHVYSPDAGHFVKLGDYEANRMRGPGGRLSVTYSKQALMEGLLHDARCAGTHVFAGVNAVDLRCRAEGVRIVTGEGRTFQARMGIAADGINSRMVRALGLNRSRRFYGTLQGVSYYMTGLSLPHPEAVLFLQLFHQPTGYPVMIWVEPSPYGDDEYWVYAGGPAHPLIDYRRELDGCIARGPFADWFRGARMHRTQAHVGNIWAPVETPFKNCMLIAGDAGWTVESECTGAMMSGLKAAYAVCEALRDGRPDRTGVRNYLDWWRRHFPEAMDYREFLTILSGGLIGEDATRYLQGLVRETLPCSLNPYSLFKSMNTAIAKQTGRIQRERPDILKQMQQLGALTIEQQFAGMRATGFPNR